MYKITVFLLIFTFTGKMNLLKCYNKVCMLLLQEMANYIMCRMLFSIYYSHKDNMDTG